jgi:hypothetical protein
VVHPAPMLISLVLTAPRRLNVRFAVCTSLGPCHV